MLTSFSCLLFLIAAGVFGDDEVCSGPACGTADSWASGDEKGLEMLQKVSVKIKNAAAKAASQAEAQSEVESLSEEAAQTEIRRSWKEGGNCTLATRGIGTHAPITPIGYYTVANLCCNYQMEYFIVRTILTLGFKVCDQGAVMGLVPWHSCRGTQSLARLAQDIHGAKPGVTTCPFVVKKGEKCPEIGAECLSGSKSYANASYHRRRVCGTRTMPAGAWTEAKPAPPAPPPPGREPVTVVGGGTNYVAGSFYTPGSMKSLWSGWSPDWPSPAPAPVDMLCKASFQNRGGTTIMQQWVNGKGQDALDAACCALCSSHAGCTFWVREGSNMGPVKCWIKDNAAMAESKHATYRGGWKRPKRCGGTGSCKAIFADFSGSRIIKKGICGNTNEELDAACCFECRIHNDCEFWVRDAGSKGSLGCELRRNPGTEYPNRPLTRGGFKQGCGKGYPDDPAQFQDMKGSQIKRLVVCGEDDKEMDASCSYLCDLEPDCEHWVRTAISPWKAFSGNQYCYLRKNGNQVPTSTTTMRGAYAKYCIRQKFKRCGASFQDLGGTLVETTRVCGWDDAGIDAACCNKCKENSLCEFWVRDKGSVGFRTCWLRRNPAAKESVSASRRGGWRESKACGDAYMDGNCRSTFKEMSGSEVGRQNVCGKNDAELDAHCCFLCRNFTNQYGVKDCQFWVRDIRKPTDGHERPVMCYLRKNPGGGSNNNNRRGGWKMPCQGSITKCVATFQERSGPQVAKIGVCGGTIEYLDSQCCNACAKTENCEFWVRETNNPDHRHGAMNSSFCYLRRYGAVNPAANANRRGGWNRICGSPDTPACWASFQEASGQQVAAVRVCGADDQKLDSECCAKCKLNEYCDFWVREKGQSGYKWCWLRKLPSSGILSKSPNANRRGGWPKQMICGDKYLSNGCRSTFRDMGGSQVGYDFVCGKTAAELDAHCCQLCRNHTDKYNKPDCSFWVREVPKSTDGAVRPMTCWLRKNPGNGGNNVLRAGGWKQGCNTNVPEVKPDFQDRGGSQIVKLGVCGDTLKALDSQCANLCAENPDCEFWVREVNLPTAAQGGTNTQFCYLRRYGSVNPSNNANKRGGWNRICGTVSAPYTCTATFQEMSGSEIARFRVCGKDDGQLDAECCEKCRDAEFCDYWVREKTKGGGYTWCYLRKLPTSKVQSKSAHGNRRGGYKQGKVCGQAYVGNGCRATFKEMGGSQSKVEFVCGKNDAEMDAMCCQMCRNDTRCTHWVREVLQPNDAKTRPKMCWLRYNTGNPSNNNNRRGGWRQGCGGTFATCKSTFMDRGGSQILKLGVCGKTVDELDNACCDLCKKNPDCEFWVREVNYPAVNGAHGGTNTQFCYLRKNGALNPSNNANKRGAWNPLRCTKDLVIPCKASFQEWSGDLVATHRVCGLTAAATDAQCCKLCRDNVLCEYWVRETRPTGDTTGFWNCWLRRRGRMTGNANIGYTRSLSANANRRGGFRVSEPCGDAYLKNECKGSFKQLGGSQAGYTFVCGSSDAELDAHCCAKCRNNTKCEYWVREAGTSGSKQCWLRYNPGGFSNHNSYRGAPRDGCGSQNTRKAEFQEWPGPEVDRFPICGSNNDQLDGACGDRCAANEDCEFWVRESGSNGYKMCWLRKIPSGNARGSGSRRGGFKTCASGSLEVKKATHQNMGGSHIKTTRICGKTNDQLDSHCSKRCDENMDCWMWLRQAGNEAANSMYKYCWLYKNPTNPSNHPNRRGGFKPQKFINQNCKATFKDMDGRQTFQARIWGENDAVLDAACCEQCTKSFNCDHWVREAGSGLYTAGGKWCWLRKKTTDRKHNRNNRRGGMKIPMTDLLLSEIMTQKADTAETSDSQTETHDMYARPEYADYEDNDDGSSADVETNNIDYGEVDTLTEEQEREALLQNEAAFKELTGEDAPEANESLLLLEDSGYSDEFGEVIRMSELGKRIPLDANGYWAVASLKSDLQMEAFVRRVAESLHLTVRDEGGLAGMLPYYSGSKTTQTFEKLLAELESIASSPAGGWVVHETGAKINELGQRATLNEQGYRIVASLRSNEQMEAFVRRALETLNLRVRDEGGLAGMLPYYSGVIMTQSYEELLIELERTAGTDPNAWIQPKDLADSTSSTESQRLVESPADHQEPAESEESARSMDERIQEAEPAETTDGEVVWFGGQR